MSRIRIAQAVEIDAPHPDVCAQWSRFAWRREIAGSEIDWRAIVSRAAICGGASSRGSGR